MAFNRFALHTYHIRSIYIKCAEIRRRMRQISRSWSIKNSTTFHRHTHTPGHHWMKMKNRVDQEEEEEAHRTTIGVCLCIVIEWRRQTSGQTRTHTHIHNIHIHTWKIERENVCNVCTAKFLPHSFRIRCFIFSIQFNSFHWKSYIIHNSQWWIEWEWERRQQQQRRKKKEKRKTLFASLFCVRLFCYVSLNSGECVSSHFHWMERKKGDIRASEAVCWRDSASGKIAKTNSSNSNNKMNTIMGSWTPRKMVVKSIAWLCG